MKSNYPTRPELSPNVGSTNEGRLVAVDANDVGEAFDAFLDNFSKSSRVTICYSLRRIADSLGLQRDVHLRTLPWHSVTAVNFQGAIRTLSQEELAPATIRLYMHAYRGLVLTLFTRGLLPDREYLRIKAIKLPKGQNRTGRGRAVENSYRDALLRTCRNDDKIQGVRDAALIALLFGSGMRRAEAARIVCEKLNLDQGEVEVQVKGGDTVVKYLTSWCIPFLEDWLRVRNAKNGMQGDLFCKISKGGKIGKSCLTGRGIFYILEKRSIEAGLPFLVRPHDARRTMGTSIIAEHGEVIAQRVLGHAHLSTTAIYDKRSDDVIKTVLKNRT